MPTNITIKNTNQRNQIKISTENLVETDKTTFGKKGEPAGARVKEWQPGTTVYLKPGELTDVWVADSRKITIQEMPT